MRRVYTHKKPDPDAVVAAWLAERYLFAHHNVLITFVAYNFPLAQKDANDCVVDLGKTYDPERLLFDHKPQAFPDRNLTCATRLIWEYLCDRDMPVHHLESLVNVVHEGDSSPPRRRSEALTESRTKGLHAYFTQVKSRTSGDDELYAGVRQWLDANTLAMHCVGQG